MTRRLLSQMIALLLGCVTAALAGCGGQPAVMVGPANGAPAEQPREPSAEPKQQPLPPAPKSDKEAAEGFSFAADRGGQLLSKLLPPPEKDLSAREGPAGPRRLPGPAAVEEPALPLPPGPSAPPRLPLATTRPARPGPLLDEGLIAGRAELPLPASQQLPAGAGVRLPSLDVNPPPPLPLLARPVPDRAALDDPTADASTTAVLAGAPAERPGPAPFLRLNLPDPFEHRLSLRGTSVPDEEPAPPVGPPRLPR